LLHASIVNENESTSSPRTLIEHMYARYLICYRPKSSGIFDPRTGCLSVRKIGPFSFHFFFWSRGRIIEITTYMYNCEAVVNERERVRIYTCAWAAVNARVKRFAERRKSRNYASWSVVEIVTRNCSTLSSNVALRTGCTVFIPGMKREKERERENHLC